MGSTRQIGWDNDTIRGGGFNDEDRYKVLKDCVDLIRVLTEPFAFMIHYDGSQYKKCSRVNRGDDTWCPNCEQLGEDTLSEKYGCLVMHLHRRNSSIRLKRGDKEFGPDNVVGVTKSWTFGGDKFADLHDVHMATEGKLRSVDLRVTLTRKKNAEKFQNLSIKEKGSRSVMSLHPDDWAEAIQHFRENKDRLMTQYFTVKTGEEIQEAQDEEGEFEPEKDRERRPRPARGSGGSTAVAEEEPQEEPEETAPPPKKKLTGAAKKAAETKAKKAAAAKKRAAAKAKKDAEDQEAAEEGSAGDDPVEDDPVEEPVDDEATVEEELSDFDKELGLD